MKITHIILLVILFFLINHHSIIPIDYENFGEENLIKSTVEGNNLRRIGMIGLFLFSIIILIQCPKQKINVKKTLPILIFLYIFWAMASLFWADNVGLTSRRLIVFLIMCMSSFVFAKKFTLHDVFIFISVSMIFFIMYDFTLELITGKFEPFSRSYRFSGTVHPNHQGVNCALLIVSSIYLAKKSKRIRNLYRLITVFGLFFLALTGCKTAFIGILFILLLLWIYSFNSQKKIILSSFAFAFFIFSIILFGSKSLDILWKFLLLGRSSVPLLTMGGRIPMWQQSVKYISDRPLIGFGYNSFWTPENIIYVSRAQGWGVGEGHSAYIDVMLGLGLIGLLIYLAILFFSIKSSLFFHEKTKNYLFQFVFFILILNLIIGITNPLTINPAEITFITMIIISKLAFRLNLGESVANKK